MANPDTIARSCLAPVYSAIGSCSSSKYRPVKEIGPRIGYFFLIGGGTITTALDTIIGMGAGVYSLLTLGSHKSANQFSANYLGNPCFCKFGDIRESQ